MPPRCPGQRTRHHFETAFSSWIASETLDNKRQDTVYRQLNGGNASLKGPQSPITDLFKGARTGKTAVNVTLGVWFTTIHNRFAIPPAYDYEWKCFESDNDDIDYEDLRLCSQTQAVEARLRLVFGKQLLGQDSSDVSSLHSCCSLAVFIILPPSQLMMARIWCICSVLRQSIQ